MQLFPDSTPQYVTSGNATPQPVRRDGGGLFGGCGFLGLFPKAPSYVGGSQPTGCKESTLFGIAEPHYVQPEPTKPPPTAARVALPTRTGDDHDEKATTRK